MSKGGRNLLLLGIASALIALVTTSISVIIYHRSGDIYLDRSRPGYLPDEEEIEAETGTKYTFQDTGLITEELLDEYLDHYTQTVEHVQQYADPFSSKALSDEALGIPNE